MTPRDEMNAAASGNVISFPSVAARESDRLTVLFQGNAILDDDGELLPSSAKLGTRDEWGWTAFRYLQCRQCDQRTHVGPGTVEVSIAAIGAVLGLAEDLAIKAGIIPAPTEPGVA